MIFKIVRKSMFKKLGLLVSIFILIVLSTMFLGISSFTYDTLSDSYEQMSNDGNAEEFKLYKTEQVKDLYTDELINDIEEGSNVTLEERKYTVYNPRDVNKTKVGIVSYNSDAKMDIPVLVDGTFPTNEGEVVLQPQTLVKLKLEIGDTLTINDVDYKISGSAYFQDFIMPTDMIFGNIFPDVTKYYPLYMNEDSFNSIDTTKAQYEYHNYYAGIFNDANQEDKDDIVANELSGSDSIYTLEIPKFDQYGKPQLTSDFKVVTQEIPAFYMGLPPVGNVGVNGVTSEVEGNKTTFYVLSAVLVSMTVALAIMLVNSIFKSQRREMGILKAEGVSINKLTFGFASFILVLSLIAGLIGGLLSRYTMTPFFLNMYTDYFYIDYYPVPLEAYLTVTSLILAVIALIVIVVTLISIRRNLSQKTLLLIKNIDTDSQPKKNRGKLFSKLSFTRRYQLNILFRNFGKTLLLFFGVFIASFLILMAMVMMGALGIVGGSAITDAFAYETSVSLQDTTSFEYNAKTSVIEKTVNVDSVSNENYKFEGKEGEEDTISIKGYDFKENDSFNMYDDKTNELITADGGIVLSEAVAKNYGLKVDDTITVEDFTVVEGDSPKYIEIKVTAISSTLFLPYAYMDINDMHTIFNTSDTYQTGFVSNEKLTNEFYNKVVEKDPNASVSESLDMSDQIASQLDMMYAVIGIISIFAGVIGFIALYSISSVIIDSNRKTISVMKVQGYTAKEVNKMTVGIYKWFVIIIYIACIPILVTLIQGIVNVATADAGFELPLPFNFVYLFGGLIIIFASYMFSSALAKRKVNKIKLSESLKSDE